MPGCEDLMDTKLEKYSIRQTEMAGASEEGQGPHRAVMPMMMMMIYSTVQALNYLIAQVSCQHFTY